MELAIIILGNLIFFSSIGSLLVALLLKEFNVAFLFSIIALITIINLTT